MVRVVLGVVTIVLMLLSALPVLATEGEVLKVVNGDTFRVEVTRSKGPETVEVHLRCSDAPILNSTFGKESKAYLENLLHISSSVNFKIQAYCGSENCVEVFAFIPSQTNPDIDYINTQMIAAGMARNDSCRGVFKEAEDQAKAAKKGIWSTTKKIVFDEPAQVAVSTGSEKSVEKPMVMSQKSYAAATITVDRAERTVTLKSRELSLSKAVSAIDSVSTVPVSLYLLEDQHFPLMMEKVPWYEALQQLVKTANLKQVNMNGKIDLYDQFFYYKHIAPYLKLSDNDGVYLNVNNGANDVPVVDDGVTRFAFINDFENSAAAARVKEEIKSGFVQVHKGDSRAPVSNDGRFEVLDEKETPAVVAAIEPVINRPALTPYNGKPAVDAKQKPVEVAAVPAVIPAVVPPVAAVRSDDESVTAVQIENRPTKEDDADSLTQTDKKRGEAESTVPAETKTVVPTYKETDSSQVLNVQLDYVQIVVLVIVVLVVVFGSIFLSRSAARRASKAEKSVEAASLIQQNSTVVDDSEPQVDSSYEQEFFSDIASDDSTVETEKAVDEIFKSEGSSPVKQAVSVQASDDLEAAVVKPTAVEHEPSDLEEKPSEQKKVKNTQSGSVKKTVADGGNFAVTLDDYARLMTPPKREPRHDCLFEVICRLGDKTATGIALDISSGGIFIDSKEKFGVGKVLELEFRLNEDDPTPIFCRGAVTWINERPDPIKVNYPNGFGVFFLELEDSAEIAISDFLHPHAAASKIDS